MLGLYAEKASLLLGRTTSEDIVVMRKSMQLRLLISYDAGRAGLIRVEAT